MGGIHKLKCKICGCFLEHKSVEGNLIKYNHSSCKKDLLIKLNEELKTLGAHLSFLKITSTSLFCG